MADDFANWSVSNQFHLLPWQRPGLLGYVLANHSLFENSAHVESSSWTRTFQQLETHPQTEAMASGQLRASGTAQSRASGTAEMVAAIEPSLGASSKKKARKGGFASVKRPQFTDQEK